MRIALRNSIFTDYYGFQQLIDIYQNLINEKDQTIEVDFSELEWLDGNMCAYFAAIIYWLRTNNNLNFTAKGNNLETKFGVLFRNGFLERDGEHIIEDNRKSVVRLASFRSDQKNEFCAYVRDELLKHRGMSQAMSENIRGQIFDDIVELLSNVEYHAKVTHPFFMCGQYYPKRGHLIFTITDLGVGFLPAIQIKSQNTITTDLEAIRWALAGHSTKPDCPGGLGLRRINQYCHNNQGVLQIITGETYYGTDLLTTMWKGSIKLKEKFMGATINLHFKL